MARRMAGTDSAFTIGLRVGQDVGNMIAKTGAVLQDRADKKKSEQVELEYNQKLQELKAPLNEVQERARNLAKEYNDKGVDMPPQEALKLRQEIRTAKVDFLTNQLDLAMTYQGSNLDNKYVQERFSKVVEGNLTQLQATAALAQQEMAQQQQEFMQRQAVTEEEGRTYRAQMGEEGADYRARLAEEGRTARAQAKGAKQTPLQFGDVVGATAMIEEEGKGKPDEFWAGLLEERGLPDTPTNRVNVQNQWVYERTMESLEGKYSPDQLAVVPKPVVLTPPGDPDEKTENLVRESVAAARRSQLPIDQDLADAGETWLAQQAEARKKKAARGEDDKELVAGREVLNEIAGRSAAGWLIKIKEIAREGGKYGASLGGDPYSGMGESESAPADEEWTGEAQEFNRETGRWEDKPSGPMEPPVGAVLRDPVEDDITSDPAMQNVLEPTGPEGRERFLDVRRVR